MPATLLFRGENGGEGRRTGRRRCHHRLLRQKAYLGVSSDPKLVSRTPECVFDHTRFQTWDTPLRKSCDLTSETKSADAYMRAKRLASGIRRGRPSPPEVPGASRASPPLM